jgi:uncharacterized protein YpmB
MFDKARKLSLIYIILVLLGTLICFLFVFINNNKQVEKIKRENTKEINEITHLAQNKQNELNKELKLKEEKILELN